MKKIYGRRIKSPRHPARIRFKPGADRELFAVFRKIGTPAAARFSPDPFQVESVEAVKKADCLVTAPTGAGKTWIAQKAIERILKKGGRSWYASPLKALSNAKYKEFSSLFGSENTGILTGDRKENPDAPVIVGTTEILRNQLYDAMHTGMSLNADFVVIDEAHYISDEERGVVWEEILIYLPQRIPLLLLSATIGNAGELAEWLSETRQKRCVVVKSKDRPVPLFPIFYHPSGKLYPLINKKKKQKGLLHPAVIRAQKAKPPVWFSSPDAPASFDRIIKVLSKFNLLPAVFFLKSRADCDSAVKGYTRLQERGKELRRKITEDFFCENPYLSKNEQAEKIIECAVASHHSGQLPAWKIMVESLMDQGLLDAVFATSTVAAGVDFPARSIVLLNSDRFNGKSFLPLTPTEFHQMAGRAGRRGKDRIGFSIIVPGRFMHPDHIAKLIKSPPLKLESQIKINFSMALNLLLSHTPDQIEELLKKSFATFLFKKRNIKSRVFPSFSDTYLINDFNRHLNFLMETGYVNKDRALTEDGIWASRLRIDQPLLVAEAFKKGLIRNVSPACIAGLTAAFVNERESDPLSDTGFVPKELLSSFSALVTGLSPFMKLMKMRGFETRPLFLRPAVTLYAWTSGFDFEEVASIADMADGDLAMLIMRACDHLRHITALKDVFPDCARAADEAIRATLRPPLVTDFG